MIISPDHHIYNDDGTYVWSPGRVKYAWWLCKNLLREFQEAFGTIYLLVGVPGAGKSTWIAQNGSSDQLYVDATFTEYKGRKDYIKLIRSMDPHKRIVAVVFHVDVEVAIQRNATRTEDRRIPEDIIRKMHQRLQSHPVTLAEGFDEIVVVS